MATTLVVIDDRDKDSAAPVLARVLAERTPTKSIRLSAFLRSIGALFDTGRGLFHFDPEHVRAQLSDVRIYNRVVGVSAESAAALDDGRQILPPVFLSGVYAQILGLCDDVICQPGINSPVGDLLPLNLQWHRMDRTLVGCKTPSFAFAVGTEPVDVSGFRKPIFKAPFNPYDWNSLATGQAPASDAFVVDRPEGDPVILSFMGSASDVFPLNSNVDLSAETRTTLASYAPLLGRTFRAFMGEALFFVSPEGTTFGAFSHYLRTSAGRRSFVELVRRAVG